MASKAREIEEVRGRTPLRRVSLRYIARTFARVSEGLLLRCG
jgi:hypothetical protein